MEINRNIDFTLLRPDAKLEDLFALCHDAKENNFRAVCVLPWMVSKAHELLSLSETSVCTVVGFPLGGNLTETKVEETKALIKAGAEEIDMVANLSAFFSKNDAYVLNDIRSVLEACHDEGVILKVIIESGLLNETQVRHICGICAEAGVDFVKTSTGFAKTHAEIEKVLLMREILPKRIEIKASGGIRSYEDAMKFLAAGATRIGTSTLIKNVFA